MIVDLDVASSARFFTGVVRRPLIRCGRRRRNPFRPLRSPEVSNRLPKAAGSQRRERPY